MALAYAILATLMDRPCSGYDLAKRLNGSAGVCWHATHQQIYRELSRLEATNLVTVEPIEQQGRPNKKHYLITESGKSALQAWIATPAQIPAIKDTLGLKIAVGYLMPRETLIQELRQHYQQHKARLEQYQGLAQSYRQQLGQLSERQKFQYAALRASIHHETARLAWCEEVFKLLAM
jgi:DNA-binding PadR family transcriptional regulator